MEVISVIVQVLLTLVFGSWVARDVVLHLRRPRLAISYRDHWSVVNRRPTEEAEAKLGTTGAPYVRESHLFVRNDGDTTARECEGVLEKVEKETNTGWKEDPNYYVTPASLEWAYSGGVRTIDLPPSTEGAARRLSLIRLSDEDDTTLSVSHVRPDHTRLTSPKPLQGWGPFRFHVAVHCENGDSSRIILEVRRTGKQSFEVEEIQSGDPRPRKAGLPWLPSARS